MSSPTSEPVPPPRKPAWIRVLTNVGALAIVAGILYAGSRFSNRASEKEETLQEQSKRLQLEASDIREAVQHQRLEEARVAAKKLAYDNPEYGSLWLLYGEVLLKSEGFDEAVSAFETATSFPQIRGRATYGLALAYGGKAEAEQALETLELAMALGYKPRNLRREPCFALLHDDSRFRRIAAEWDDRIPFNPEGSLNN